MIQKCSTWRVFKEFSARPQKSFQLRELSRKVRLAPSAVKLHLASLEKEGMVRKDRTGMYVSYKANFDSDRFRFYKKISNLILLGESGLIAELKRKTTPDAIVLFGSFSKGEDIESSDIDLCVIAKEKEIDLSEYEKKLSRKVQLFFAEKIEKFPGELQNNIVNGIIMSGFIRWKA